MDDTTSLLFGLDSFRVVDVVRVADRMVQVVVETVARQGFCPDGGTASGRVKDRPCGADPRPASRRPAGGAVVAQAPTALPGLDVCASVVHPVTAEIPAPVAADRVAAATPGGGGGPVDPGGVGGGRGPVTGGDPPVAQAGDTIVILGPAPTPTRSPGSA